MRAWVNGRLLDDPDGSRDHRAGPRVDRRRRGLRGGQGGGRPAVRADPAPRPAGPVRGRDWACPTPTRTRYAGAWPPSCDGQDLPLGRLRITYTGGVAPLGLRAAATARRRWSWSPRPCSPAPRTDGGGDGAVAAQRARRPGRAQDDVVRRERGRPGPRPPSAAPPRRSSPTWPATSARAPGRNVFYVVDGELRTPTLASGCLAGISRALLLEWYGAREVDEPVEVLDAGRRDLPGVDDPRRAAGAPVRRP